MTSSTRRTAMMSTRCPRYNLNIRERPSHVMTSVDVDALEKRSRKLDFVHVDIYGISSHRRGQASADHSVHLKH
jgi:hypothetical protein